MSKNNQDLNAIVGDYKYGFKTDAEAVLTSGKGLSEAVVAFISDAKKEPLWMKEFRLKAYESFTKLNNPLWGPDLSEIDFNAYTYYIKSTEKTENNW